MFSQICTMILSPPKFKYSLYDLGSSISKYGKRSDFFVFNKKNQKMSCSYYKPFQVQQQKCCLIYLHSMNGSRLQSTLYLDHILKLGISFCCFDFSGCGNSEGSKISFGANEKYQVQIVLNELRQKFKINRFILWGRSMGAVCAIKYSQMVYQKSPSVNKDEIIGLILDSSFNNFSKLIIQIGSNRTDIPKFLVKAGYYLIKKSLEQNGEFKINDLNLVYDEEGSEQSPIQKIKGNNLAILFLASKEDKTVPYMHSVEMYNAFNSNRKQLKFFKGHHNESRDEEYINEVIAFLKKIFESERQSHLNPIKSLRAFRKNSQFSILNEYSLTSSILSQSRSSYQRKKSKENSLYYFSKDEKQKDQNSLLKKLEKKQQMKQKQNQSLSYQFQNSQARCVCSMFNSEHMSGKLKNTQTNRAIQTPRISQVRNMPLKKFNQSFINKLQQINLLDQKLQINLLESNVSYSKMDRNSKSNKRNQNTNGSKGIFHSQNITENVLMPIKCSVTN